MPARPLVLLAVEIPAGSVRPLGGFDPGRERRALPIPTRAPSPARRPRSTGASWASSKKLVSRGSGARPQGSSFARKTSLAHDPKSFARDPKSCAHKAPGLARQVPEPDCRARSPAREAPRLGREARRAGAEAEGLKAGARGLGREAWRPGEPARRKAGDAARPPAPLSPARPTQRDLLQRTIEVPTLHPSLPPKRTPTMAPWKNASGPASPRPPSISPSRASPPCSIQPEFSRHE